MTESVLKVPDDLPLPGLVVRLNNLIAEENLKWKLSSKSVDVLALDDKDLTEFEMMRDQVGSRKKDSGW